MSAAHTAGPWTATRSADKRTGFEVRGGDKLAGADKAPLIARLSNYTPLAEREANARMIAAAPELLDALRRITQTTDAARMWQIAQDAIAKVQP